MNLEDFEEGGFYALLAQSGTGKSYTLKELAAVPGFIRVCSTTGISAVNLADENSSAVTINSALKYFDAASLKRGIQDKSIFTNIKKIARYFKFLGIDEISMMSGDVLDLIVYAVSVVNAEVPRKLGILLVGDIHQLAPVGQFNFKGTTKAFGKPFFLASTWSKFNVHHLTEVKRQTDREFLENLNLLKRGNASNCVDWFINNVEFDDFVDRSFTGTTLFSVNDSVEDYNKRCLESLPGEVRKYASKSNGNTGGIGSSIPSAVELKTGSLVMILVNNWKKGYANGDLALVRQMFSDKIKVELLRNEEEKIIEYNSLNNVDPSNKVLGTISYLPVRLASAVTVHKCLSGDSVISTSTGVKRLSSLSVGDLVLTHKNRYRKVLAKAFTGVKKSTIVKGEEFSIVGSEDHRVLTYIEGNFIYKTIGELDVGDTVCLLNGEINTPEDKSLYRECLSFDHECNKSLLDILEAKEEVTIEDLKLAIQFSLSYDPTPFIFRTQKVVESNYFYSKVTSIESGGVRPMWDIEVYGDSSFVADGVVVHNCQGLSLDKVQIKLTGRDLSFLSRLHGGLYTAISRCRTKEGLRIVGNRSSFIKACKFDEVYEEIVY